MKGLAEFRRKSAKAARLAVRGRYRHGLRNGVAATIEHRCVGWVSDFRTVIDVGANRGQFSLFALETFPRAHLYAFEPLAACSDILRTATSRDHERVSVLETALGGESGSVEFHVSARGDSSSVLEIGPNQVRLHPGTDSVGSVLVSLDTLDHSLAELEIVRPCLLKIDVQGFELEVLEGAARTLQSVDELLVEVSFVELYLGQHLAPDVFDHLSAHGFYPAGIHNVSADGDRRPIQADVHFLRLTNAGG